MKTVVFTFLAGIAVVLAGCSARRGEPLTGARHGGDPRIERGRVVFMQHCNKCHPGGEAGLGPAINDKPLPEFLMKTQVRVGLGAMPSFHRQQISDQELDDLIRFMKALRGNRS
jgi:mono/diheme cytochrome c family protein